MRVTSVELHPSGSSEVCTLSFRDPARANPYNAKDITGLDATDGLAPNYYGKAGNSASNFYNLVMQKRSIVLTIALNPNFSINKSYSDLRDDLYRMISSSRTGLIQLRFLNGTDVVAAISGFVSKFESQLFDKAPSAILTLNAVDPMLAALDPTEFPVAGLNLATFVVSDAISTAPHGFDFVARVTAHFASLGISDPIDSSWSFTVNPDGGFLVGDELHFSSDPKNKTLYLVRDNSPLYLADVITPGSVWPIMFPGDNHLSFTNSDKLVLESFSYFPTYWGV